MSGTGQRLFGHLGDREVGEAYVGESNASGAESDWTAWTPPPTVSVEQAWAAPGPAQRMIPVSGASPGFVENWLTGNMTSPGSVPSAVR